MEQRLQGERGDVRGAEAVGRPALQRSPARPLDGVLRRARRAGAAAHLDQGRPGGAGVGQPGRGVDPRGSPGPGPAPPPGALLRGPHRRRLGVGRRRPQAGGQHLAGHRRGRRHRGLHGAALRGRRRRPHRLRHGRHGALGHLSAGQGAGLRPLRRPTGSGSSGGTPPTSWASACRPAWREAFARRGADGSRPEGAARACRRVPAPTGGLRRRQRLPGRLAGAAPERLAAAGARPSSRRGWPGWTPWASGGRPSPCWTAPGSKTAGWPTPSCTPCSPGAGERLFPVYALNPIFPAWAEHLERCRRTTGWPRGRGRCASSRPTTATGWTTPPSTPALSGCSAGAAGGAHLAAGGRPHAGRGDAGAGPRPRGGGRPGRPPPRAAPGADGSDREPDPGHGRGSPPEARVWFDVSRVQGPVDGLLPGREVGRSACCSARTSPCTSPPPRCWRSRTPSPPDWRRATPGPSATATAGVAPGLGGEGKGGGREGGGGEGGGGGGE